MSTKPDDKFFEPDRRTELRPDSKDRRSGLRPTWRLRIIGTGIALLIIGVIYLVYIVRK